MSWSRHELVDDARALLVNRVCDKDIEAIWVDKNFVALMYNGHPAQAYIDFISNGTVAFLDRGENPLGIFENIRAAKSWIKDDKRKADLIFLELRSTIRSYDNKLSEYRMLSPSEDYFYRGFWKLLDRCIHRFSLPPRLECHIRKDGDPYVSAEYFSDNCRYDDLEGLPPTPSARFVIDRDEVDRRYGVMGKTGNQIYCRDLPSLLEDIGFGVSAAR